MKSRRFHHLLGAHAASCLALASAGLARAQSDVDAQQTTYRSGLAQEAIRQQSNQVRDDLAQMISELKMNGLSSASIDFLTKASGRLSSLSQEDMQKVILALQTAGTQQSQQRQDSIVTAYQGQKNIALKLKTLASELNAQEVQNELPAQLEVLIVRQSANLRSTTALRDSGKTPAQLDDPQKALHAVVTSEQNLIGGEINLLIKTLGTAATQGNATDPATAAARQALDIFNGTMLSSMVPLAYQNTDAGPFNGAVDHQKAVRDYLVQALQALVAKEDASTRLDQARSQLDQIISDQKDVADATQSKLDSTTLAQRQEKIADQTEIAQSLLTPLNHAAGQQLGAAQQQMAQTAAALDKTKNAADTAPQQQQVAKTLDGASKMLDDQIAALQQQQSQSPLDEMADLQKIQNQLKQDQQTDQANPQAAEKDLENVQQKDAGQLPADAASAVADAADKLGQTQPDAGNANKDLDQAIAAIQKAQDAAAKDAAAYQALQQEDAKLAQAEQEATAADGDLQKNPKGDLSQAVQQLSAAASDTTQASTADQASQAAQASAASQSSQASQASQSSQGSQPTASSQGQGNQPTPSGQGQGPAPTTPGPGPGQAIADATAALKDAANSAVQSKGSDADGQTQKGIAAIKAARSALADAMASIQGDSQSAQSSQSQSDSSQMASASHAAHAGYMYDRGVQTRIGGVGGGYSGPGNVVGTLKPKDRDAITQYAKEKAPAEYAPQVQQYLKNLADYGNKD